MHFMVLIQSDRKSLNLKKNYHLKNIVYLNMKRMKAITLSTKNIKHVFAFLQQTKNASTNGNL